MPTYEEKEISIDDSEPVELYLFRYDNEKFCYTSTYRYKNVKIGDEWYNFLPEFIRRGDSLKLGDSGGTMETCTITVGRTNNVALLYQGTPPEKDKLSVEIYRMQGNEYIKILRGVVSQVVFSKSEVQMTVTIENVLNREIPTGKLSYNCQNRIYDAKCGLNKEDFALKCTVLGGHSQIKGLTIRSNELATKPSGYFTNGYMVMGRSVRGIKEHSGNMVRIKYPINLSERQSEFVIYPGCENIFPICERKFKNHKNFSGIPYIQPFDIFKHPVDNRLGYWIEDSIVRDSHGKLHTMGLG